jgi:ribulose kinase
MQYLLGIDIGTTSTIGILIGLPDKVLATASRPVTLSPRTAAGRRSRRNSGGRMSVKFASNCSHKAALRRAKSVVLA